MQAGIRHCAALVVPLILLCPSPAGGEPAAKVEVVADGPSPAGGEPAAKVEVVADGLSLPSSLVLPFGTSRWILVAEQHEGRVRLIEQGRMVPAPFLDISDRMIADPNYEEGLLGLAVSPGTATHLYVTYIARDGDLVLSRFEVTEAGRAARAGSEQTVLRIARDARMHHCGHIEFSPTDGKLYLCVGDTQPNEDPAPVAQDLGRPHGKILRLEVEPFKPTLVAENSFMAASAAQATSVTEAYEIRALGLRNPWGFTFDPGNGDLIIPDVGHKHWEEINVQRAAGPIANYGWPYAEGNECFERCDLATITWPVYEYAHRGDRCAVSGGAVYRGPEASWQGSYVFGDLCSGELWALRSDGLALRKLADTQLMPTAFAAGDDGAILVADAGRGAVWRIVLPETEEGWLPVQQAMFDTMLDARRVGFGRVNQRVQKMLHSRAWRWTRPIHDLVSHLRHLSR